MLKRITICFLHAIFSVFLLGWYINTNYVSEEEEKLIQGFYFKYLHHSHDDEALQKTILINTAREIALLDDPRDYGKIDITDREKLVQLFHAINSSEAKPRLILCDIFFDIKTDQDSLLQAEFNQLPQLIVPYVISEEKDLQPVFKANKGLATYYSHADKMVKIQLMSDDGLETLPLKADAMVNKRHYYRKLGFLFCNNQPVLNSIIPAYHIRPHMIKEMGGVHDVQHGVPLYNIHDMTVAAMDTIQFRNYLKGKIVVIGNFGNRDLHLTPIGPLPGALILLNTFFTLDDNEHFIRLGWVIFLLIAFTVLSYMVFYLGFAHFHSPAKGILGFILNSFFLRFISISLAVFVISLVSFFLFNIHVNILFVALYYSLIGDYLKFRRDEKATLHH